MDHPTLAELFRKEAVSYFDEYLPRIVRCLQLLSEREIWWRPNASSNAAGNIVLHLCGNIRQWIIAGLSGAADNRERDKEFAERGPVSRRALIARLKNTVKEARTIIAALPDDALVREFGIQGYAVSGQTAISHVYEHFSYHAGHIIYLTKMKRGKDLRFTRLPAIKPSGKPQADRRP